MTKDEHLRVYLDETEKILVGDGAPCAEMAELKKKLDEKFDDGTWALDEQLWKIFSNAVASDDQGDGFEEMERLTMLYVRANAHDRVAMDHVAIAFTGWSFATMLRTAAAGFDSCEDFDGVEEAA